MKIIEAYFRHVENVLCGLLEDSDKFSVYFKDLTFDIDFLLFMVID